MGEIFDRFEALANIYDERSLWVSKKTEGNKLAWVLAQTSEISYEHPLEQLELTKVEGDSIVDFLKTEYPALTDIELHELGWVLIIVIEQFTELYDKILKRSPEVCASNNKLLKRLMDTKDFLDMQGNKDLKLLHSGEAGVYDGLNELIELTQAKIFKLERGKPQPERSGFITRLAIFYYAITNKKPSPGSAPSGDYPFMRLIYFCFKLIEDKHGYEGLATKQEEVKGVTRRVNIDLRGTLKDPVKAFNKLLEQKPL